MTPEREYLLVTEFFDGAKEIGDVEVDDDLIDQGLLLVRRLWDAGLAHRDIKPANLLVQDGELLLIDVAFAQVRPSPWRQAVDLANMMLVLAVRTRRRAGLRPRPALLHARRDRRGLRRHPRGRQPDAAARGDEAGRARPDRRVPGPGAAPAAASRSSGGASSGSLLAAVILVGAFLAVQAVFGLFVPAQVESAGSPVLRHRATVMILMAQSVPTATSIPCVGALPAGWQDGGVNVRRGRSTFWLDFQPGGHPTPSRSPCSRRAAARPTRRSRCRATSPGCAASSAPRRCPPSCTPIRTYVFEGGCVTYDYALGRQGRPGARVHRRQRPRLPAPVASGGDRGRSHPRAPVVRCGRATVHGRRLRTVP